MEVIIEVGGDKIKLAPAEGQRGFMLLKKVKPQKERSSKSSEWRPFNWFSSLSGAMHKLLEMKVGASDARTLIELQQELEKARAELVEVYSWSQ